MSRRGRASNDVCGDCGASDPSWASINRGILLCAECCSVHRSFGRHISQIKSLHQGSWSPTLLAMVHAMGTHGVNSIWEHLLHDPSAKNIRIKKPQPKDNLHPTKAEFIRAKHMQLAYILKPSQDDSQCENDLSKQLHASVRSPNLETSVRLLVQGADPNYLHDEKGTTPLHAAARAGQMNQIELLIVYGADPTAIDNQGQTPIDTAVACGNKQMAQRLVECCYETTDRLIFYLCKRRPDHARGQHFTGPELWAAGENMAGGGGNRGGARGRLQLLPNHLFEELVRDLYDEIDRRENEAIWQTGTFAASVTDSNGGKLCASSVPFLPVNPQLSTTRNQGRQKLARFAQRELSALVFDVLTDVKRRHYDSMNQHRQHHGDNAAAAAAPGGDVMQRTQSNSLLTTSGPLRGISQISDDEPLYDSVASDDDYSTLPLMTAAGGGTNDTSLTTQPNNKSSAANMSITSGSSSQSSPTHSHNNNNNNSSGNSQKPPIEATLRQELQYAQSKITELNSLVQQLTSENCELKQRSSNISTTSSYNLSNCDILPRQNEFPLVRSMTHGSSMTDVKSQLLTSGGSVVNPLLPSNDYSTSLLTNSTDATYDVPVPLKEQQYNNRPNLNTAKTDIAAMTEAARSQSTTGSRLIIDGNLNENEPVHDTKKSIGAHQLLQQQRPQSMYETREGPKILTSGANNSTNAAGVGNNAKQSLSNNEIQLRQNNAMTQSMYQYQSYRNNNSGTINNDGSGATLLNLPLSEEVIRRTDQVTKRIQELWNCIQQLQQMQSNVGSSGSADVVVVKRDAFVPCAERIRVAVAELTAIFPQTVSEEAIIQSLRSLNANTGQLQSQCAALQIVLNEMAPQIGKSDYFLHEVRSSAYEIAKATKQLITMFQEPTGSGNASVTSAVACQP